MNKTLASVAGSAVLLLGAGMAIAQSAPGHTPRQPMKELSRAELVQKLDARFAKMDANGDGSVSRDEMKAARQASKDQRFARLDRDGNGAISRAEFDQRSGDRTGGGGGRHGHHGGGMGMHGFAGRGGKLDANGDGAISKAEFEGRALAMFDRVDTNRDGVISPAERQQARAAFKARQG